jgi:hypothetical protein
MNEDDRDNAFIEMVKTGTRMRFEHDKTVEASLVAMNPAKHAVKSKEDAIVYRDLMPFVDNKDRMLTIIHAARLNTRWSAFITEAWLSEYDLKPGQTHADIMKKVPPSEDPNRKEVVLIHVFLGMESRLLYAEIIRPDDGNPFLSNWEEMPSNGMSSRFMTPPPNWN